MSFSPIRICVLYDNARGYCGRAVPELVRQLESRSFIVDTHDIADGPVRVDDYAGLVLGTPVFGLALRGSGPTDAMERFIGNMPALSGRRVAVFCVYQTRPGDTFDRMKRLLFAKGAELVAEQAFWVLRPTKHAHVIPTECMVRVR